MKKIYFLAFSLTIAFSSQAQYTVTAAFNPVPGDMNDYYKIDTTGVSFGSSGTGQVWNYTTLNVSASPTLVTETYTTVGSTPAGASFPAANLASSSTENPGQFTYYNASTLKYDLIGATVTSTNNLVYSNPETLYTIPFSYGSSSVDNFSGSVSIGTFTINRTGTITTTGDGTGTLNLPGGISYSNVLKIKITQTIVDVYMPAGGQTMVSTNYVWVNAMAKFGILSVNMNSTTSGSVTTKNKEVQIRKSAFVGLNEQALSDNNFSVYPNPANSKANIIFVAYTNDIYKAIIVNALGQEVKSINFTNINIGSNNQTLDLSGLNTGLYFIKLSSKNTEGIQKIMVQ